MKKVATLILNRNLPEVTDRLYSHIEKYDGEYTDIFVIEAGSDKDKLSARTTWYADWPEAKKEGLRYARGMNYGLSMLYKENKFYNYDAFFLLTNDTELEEKKTIKTLVEIFNSHAVSTKRQRDSTSLGRFSLSCNSFNLKKLSVMRIPPLSFLSSI